MHVGGGGGGSSKKVKTMLDGEFAKVFCFFVPGGQEPINSSKEDNEEVLEVLEVLEVASPKSQELPSNGSHGTILTKLSEH